MPLDARPARRGSGFQEFGLPFAADPAVTRYLAAFLTAHRHVAMDDAATPTADHDPARPDIVLLQRRAVRVARPAAAAAGRAAGAGSPAPAGDWQPMVLDNDRLDLAVARGAAYYGMVRRGQGVRIAAGLARTLLHRRRGRARRARRAGDDRRLAGRAVCLVPAGVEPGHDVDLTQRRFDLLVSEPVEFPLYVSSTRLTDRPGELVPLDREQMTPLPPIRTVLRTRKKGEAETVSVHLHARLTEIGTLDLWCSEVDGRRSWRLQFDVRSATQTDVAAHESAAEREGFVDEAIWQECRALIDGTFGPDGSDKPEGLAKRLAAATGRNRNAWPTSLCRRIWEALMEVEAGRRRSQVHEARWLNLLGFALRPGYGLAVDDWRVAETWRIVQGKLVHPTRRLPRGRLDPLAADRRRAGGRPAAGPGRAAAGPGPRPAPPADDRQGPRRRFQLPAPRNGRNLAAAGLAGTAAAGAEDRAGRHAPGPAAEAEDGAGAAGHGLGRRPDRRPRAALRPAERRRAGRGGRRAGSKRLMALRRRGDPAGSLAVMQLARRTDDRYRDLPEKLARGRGPLAASGEHAPAHFVELVRAGRPLGQRGAGPGLRRVAAEGIAIGVTSASLPGFPGAATIRG